MSPKEKTVIRAIIKALKTGHSTDMDSFATSYLVSAHYQNYALDVRSVMMLEALVDAS